ncbi:MAG: hypothetical protein AUK43_11580 [Oscillatoriales cyanobacterium CG2_30_40_61]|nr:MAG: hypothetical protein AUK43_11580 [Oscillatoriales cyanobacterium CG2_30_40_61]
MAVSFSRKPGFCRGSARCAYPPHPRFAGVSGMGATTGGMAPTKNQTALEGKGRTGVGSKLNYDRVDRM